MKIAVILGSIRGIRRGGRVAKWLMPQLRKWNDIEFELLDLNDYPLPFYNESNSPDDLNGNYANELGKKWAAKIGEADAFILITPEYNHGPSAVLKNALDWVFKEWNRKPVTFISYSPNAAGGIRAVEQLRQVAVELKMAPIQHAIHITYVLDTLDEEGNILKGHLNEKLDDLMEELLWWTHALKIAREKIINANQ